MKMRILGVACFALVATFAVAQMDPLSGTWTGDWGPSAMDRNEVTLELKWDGHALSGVVNPGPNAIELMNASFNAGTGMFTAECEAPGRGGATYHYKIEGKLEGNTLSGSWNHDDRNGDFKITKGM